jgi:hypothetical protein
MWNPKENKEQMQILKEWTEYVRTMFATRPEYRVAFRNPTREFILEQREFMAEMGTECTPDEVSALIRLISETLDSDT